MMRRVTELMARALGELGVNRAFVVHGADGLDEISISGETSIAELRDGIVRSYSVTPEDFGLRRAPLDAIRGGDAKQNAEIIHKVLGRSMLYRDHGPHREIVLANAAAALVVAGLAADLLDGARLAAKSIDSGAAREKLDAFVAFSTEASEHRPVRECSNTQKIFEEFETGAGQDRLRMELHAFDAKFAVTQTHDCAVGGFGGNFQRSRQRLSLDDQRVIARGRKILR